MTYEEVGNIRFGPVIEDKIKYFIEELPRNNQVEKIMGLSLIL